MSTENWYTVSPLAGGLRKIVGTFHGAALDANSSFTVHVGNIERIVEVLQISNDSGYVTEIAECTIVRNNLNIVVRQNPAGAGPHALVPMYTDLSGVEFRAVIVVH